ncbi:MAG: sigma-70 family RNA polymerase sigma factor [Eubacterium sp.]|nr:sigma-70 family RNA polymerase sigma factor [Eubacterium sp.]
MEDREIIGLFFDRSERAVSCLADKYGKIFLITAQNILGSREDAEECVNDAYLGVWNSIPPKYPSPLLPYVCRIVRNIAVDKLRKNTAQKRGSGYDLSLTELGDFLSSDISVEQQSDANMLAAQLNEFLGTLDKEQRIMFVRRYWYCDSVKEIAERMNISSGAAAVRLSRIRKELKSYLKDKGVTV